MAGPYLVTGTELHGGTVAWERCHRVSDEVWERDPRIQLSPGDLLVTKDGTIGKIAVVAQPPGRATLNSGVFRVTPRKPLLDPRFAFWVLCSRLFTDFIDLLSSGSTINHLYQADFVNFALPFAPLNEQRAVADYLDHETARIDSLIEKKQRMVALLEARTWIAFGDRVAESQSPVVPVRRTLMSLIDGPFGSAFSSSDYSATGAIVVRLGNIGFSRYRAADQARIPMTMFHTFRHYQVKQGDLLIAGLGDDRNHAGRACVAPDLGPAIVKGKCFRGRVDRTRANAEFLALLLSSPMGAQMMNVSGRGSTRSMINLEIVKNTAIPLPKVEDQARIVMETRAQQARTMQATDVLAQQINLLRERRQALITAAVTGELDVAAAAA
jgi:type I restriction enzyme S subunit